MKIIVAGGRDFADYELVCWYLDKVPFEFSIVCGMAKGADALGKRYAEEHSKVIHKFPADWDTHGKSAGYIRNKQMAEFSDALLAFWNKESKGTKHMIDLANKNNLKVKVVYY